MPEIRCFFASGEEVTMPNERILRSRRSGRFHRQTWGGAGWKSYEGCNLDDAARQA